MRILDDTDFGVGKVVVRGRATGLPGIRIRTERLLEGVSEQPLVARSAILCIRELGHRMSISPLHANNAFGVSAERKRLETALRTLARTAACPAIGPVPGNAAAVYFADRSELLCCLADDLITGSIGDRWWWQSLFRKRPARPEVEHALIESLAFVPSVLERLAKRGTVVRVIDALGAHFAEVAIVGLVESFGLHSLPVNCPAESGLFGRRLGQAATLATRPSGAGPDLDAEVRPVTAENALSHSHLLLARYVPEALIPTLPPAGQMLLVIALGLARAPSLARSNRLLIEFERWRLAADHGAEPTRSHDMEMCRHSMPEDVRFSAQRPSPDYMAAKVSTRRRETSAKPRSFDHFNPTHPSGKEVLGRASVAPIEHCGAFRQPHMSIPDGFRPASIDPASASRGRSQFRVSVEQPGYPSKNVAHTRTDAGVSARHVQGTLNDWANAIWRCDPATQFGGLFCLLNAAIALELYGDFTTPDEPGIALSPWDFLALAGERLLGPAIRRDTVWLLLAELAGREPDIRPGAFFDPPSEWRIPSAWLAPFAGGRAAWRWSDEHGRLRVCHPAGFCVLDVARGRGRAENRLRREMAALRDAACGPLVYAPDRFAAPEGSPLDRWAGWLMPYLGRRIARAFGRRAAGPAMRLLVCRPARVEIGTARIDIRSPLAELPIEVRVAGLDRDPGWIPAAGRFVAFHYD